MLANRDARTAVVILLLAAGCSFNSGGINAMTTDADEATGGSGTGGDGGTTGTGGGGGTFGGGSGGGVRLDGSAGFPDSGGADRVMTGDAPLAADAPALPPDVGPTDAPGAANGVACTSDGTCASGFCVDKLCCEKRCGDPCFSCSKAITGADDGLCRPDIANTVCGAASCSGSTRTPPPRCDGNGTCTPRSAMPCPNNLTCADATQCKAKCAGDGDCTGGLVCDVAAGACRVPGKSNGQVCMAGSECMTGNCSDGVCCDAPCTGVCRSCRMAATGKPDGTCGTLAAGAKDARCTVQDPSTCGRDGTCEAGGRCHLYPAGTACGSECCRDGGGGPRACSYQCNGSGLCDKQHPIVDRCQGPTACCCATSGGAMCATIGALCQGTCVQ